MVNPYVIGMSKDGKPLALVLGYVLGVKDKGNVNMLLFKKDNTDPESEVISVAAWGLSDGQHGADMREMTKDLKGRYVACVVTIRKKVRDGKTYETCDLEFLVKPPSKSTA